MSESESGTAEARTVPAYLRRVEPIAQRLRALFWARDNREPTPAEQAEFAAAVYDEVCPRIRRARKSKPPIGGTANSGRRVIAPSEKRRVLKLAEHGHSQRSIARATKLDRKTIAKILIRGSRL